MNTLALIAAIIGLSGNIPLILGIYKNNIYQNFTAWMLWGVLDIIATTSIILQHGNFWLPVGYTLGSASVAILLAYKKQIRWTWFETIVTILVVICISIWSFLGNRGANIASVSAICIASFPLIKDTLKDPKATPTFIYLIYCVANTLAMIAGKSWSIEEELYPAGVLSFSLLLVILSLRKQKSIIAGTH